MEKIYNIDDKCKICKRKGSIIFSENFLNKKNFVFLKNFYKKKFFIYLQKKKFKNYQHVILNCDKCNFVWQEKSLKKKYSGILYDKIIDYKKSYKKNKLKYLKNNQFLLEEYLIKKIIKKKSKIIDIGAGWGNWLQNFSNYYNLFGVEFSKTRQKKLKKLKINIVNEKQFFKYQNFFSVIKLDQVLEHIDDLDNFLYSTSKLSSKRNRLIIISVPDGRKAIKNLDFYAYRKGPIQPLEHLNCFTNSSLVKLLRKFGFKRLNLIQLCWIFAPFLIKNPNKLINFIKRIYDQFYGTSIIFK